MVIYSQKYFSKYNQIIRHFKDLSIPKSKSTESHHIIPKSMGGDNSRDNLVRVPTRVHFLLHWMLYRIYRTSGMSHAWNMMCINTTNGTSHSYLYARLRHSEAMTGKIHSIETRKKRSNSMIGKNIGKIRSVATRQKISAANMGRVSPRKGCIVSDETKQKQSLAKIGSVGNNTGKTHSQETKNRIAEFNRNLPIIECPHCKKQGKGNAMKQYHFDRCKFNLSQPRTSSQ